MSAPHHCSCCVFKLLRSAGVSAESILGTLLTGAPPVTPLVPASSPVVTATPSRHDSSAFVDSQPIVSSQSVALPTSSLLDIDPTAASSASQAGVTPLASAVASSLVLAAPLTSYDLNAEPPSKRASLQRDNSRHQLSTNLSGVDKFKGGINLVFLGEMIVLAVQNLAGNCIYCFIEKEVSIYP